MAKGTGQKAMGNHIPPLPFALCPMATETEQRMNPTTDTLRDLIFGLHSAGCVKFGEFKLKGAILSDGKSARLVDRLEMKERIAQGVSAGQSSMALGSAFMVVATPKPGVSLERLERAIDQEIARIAAGPPSQVEVERARNKIEAGAVFGLEPVGGFGGRAASLAGY